MRFSLISKGHRAEVGYVDWCKDDEVKFATGSDDGSVRVWETRFEKGSDGLDIDMASKVVLNVRK